MDFPIDTYLAAFQQKYANEQAAKPDIAKTLANSISQGGNVAINQFYKEQELQKQRAWEGYQAYTKDKKLVSITDGSDAPMDAVLSANDMVAKGRLAMKGNKDGSLLLADKNGNALYKWVPQQTSVFGTLQTGVKNVPEGYEIEGYDEKGNPKIKKKADEAVNLKKLRDEAKARAEGTLAGGMGGAAVDKVVFEQENKLRDDFRKDAGDFPKIRDAYTRVLESAKDPSAAGDVALIFNYMKILDPNSVVRESEYATAANAGSVPERIRAQYNKALSGERLDPNVRADFVDRSGKLYSGANKQFEKTKINYIKRAKDYGLNADRIMTDYDIAGQEEVKTKKIPSYATEADVLKNPPPKGTEIIIAGRRAVWE